MRSGSVFTAGLMAGIVLRLLEPGPRAGPFWHLLLASLVGGLLAIGLDRLGDLRRQRRLAARHRPPFV